MNPRIMNDWRPIWATTMLFTLMNLTAFCQSDLVVGPQYPLNIQRQNINADAYLLHNAQYHSSGGTYSWNTSHPSFGSRGIKLSYVDGIHFFADNQTATTGATFTPSTRFFIGNSGRIGIGTIAPASALEVVGPNTGTGPTIHAAGGGDIVLNPGGALFLDGNYSYATGNYIRPIGGSNTQGFFTTGQERMRIAADGKIGIGTASPADQLEIVSSNKKIGFNTAIAGITNGGTLSLSRSDGLKILYMGSSSSPQDDPVLFGMGGETEMRLISGGGYSQGFGFYTNTTLPIAFGARNMLPAPVVKITGDGKMGIGTTTPDQKLTVKGKIHAEEVIIDLSVPAPDYVFEKSYELKSLDEVKKFIDKNKHLPEVPSAHELEKDGVKVGEMEMILLKKIEEITLYVIELNKQLREVQEKNLMYEKKILELSTPQPPNQN